MLTPPVGCADSPHRGGDISATIPAPDPDSIVLFGDSAGGNLAAAVSLMARDRGEFMPRTQMLLYPVVGNDYNPETSPFESVRTNGTDYILTAQDMADYIDMYRSSVADLTNPYFAPLTAHDLSNQPRTLVLSAEYCPLRDEDEAYARRLQLVNDNVSCYRIHDGIHGYLLNTSAVGLVSTTYRIIEHFLDDTPLVPAPGTGTTANAPEGGDAWQDVLGTD
ncbi:carboxylesterase or lipase [Bifidobacterium longum subsp. longum JDM301]|uniref:Carboxylesterase or lipase n=1 Tax=Bifidobacterium longum subsp. longum (strain JDM301) TaxID=759350 RepID=D6ZT52_BIFLJ|nr:carboxylesterase or lipase [Bifidobacterium longum subsp. longum JDM301]